MAWVKNYKSIWMWMVCKMPTVFKALVAILTCRSVSGNEVNVILKCKLCLTLLRSSFPLNAPRCLSAKWLNFCPLEDYLENLWDQVMVWNIVIILFAPVLQPFHVELVVLASIFGIFPYGSCQVQYVHTKTSQDSIQYIHLNMQWGMACHSLYNMWPTIHYFINWIW